MKANLDSTYRDRFLRILCPVATQLETLLREYLRGTPRIDRVSTRAKSPDRFLEKAAKQLNGSNKYANPLSQIQDQIGARVVVLYEQDVAAVGAAIDRYFHRFERQQVVPEREWEFGYFGLHYVLGLPRDAIPPEIAIESAPEQFELQVKTLWQHAWSEANHDLGYKPTDELSSDQRRRLAYTAAQAWGADRMFAELFRENDQRNSRVVGCALG